MANFDLKQIIQKQAQREVESFEHNRKWSWGITVGVDYDDSPAVLGMPGYIYVREHSTQVDGRGGLLRVFNNTVPLQVGLMVKIARNPNDPSQRQVIGSDTGDTVYTSWWDGGPGSGGPHHESHEWPDGAPGSDPVSVYKRALVPLRTYPSSSLYAMNVDVAPILYKLNGVPAYYAGDSNFDLSAYAPTATSDTVYALIYLDTADNTLKVTTETYSGGFWEGGLPGSTLAANLPYFPSLPEGGMASAVIIIQGADTTVTESMIYDVRTLFDPPQIPHPIVLDSSSILSIGSGGAVAAISDYHLIASSGLYGSTVATITPASDYQLLVLQAAPGEVVRIAHALGNVFLNSGEDFILAGDRSLMLFYDGANWSDVGTGITGGGLYLNDLYDVNAVAPIDGDVLTWDDDASEWVPAAPTGGGDDDGRILGGYTYISNDEKADYNSVNAAYNDIGVRGELLIGYGIGGILTYETLVLSDGHTLTPIESHSARAEDVEAAWDLNGKFLQIRNFYIDLIIEDATGITGPISIIKNTSSAGPSRVLLESCRIRVINNTGTTLDACIFAGPESYDWVLLQDCLIEFKGNLGTTQIVEDDIVDRLRLQGLNRIELDWPNDVGLDAIGDTNVATEGFLTDGEQWFLPDGTTSPVASALDDLTDVNAPSPSDGQALVWDSGAGEWVADDVTPDALAYAETIGDGIETDYAVIHDLGTTDVVVQVWDISGAAPVEATGDVDAIEATDADTVTISFQAAPSTDQYRVVVLASGGGGGGGGVDILAVQVFS